MSENIPSCSASLNKDRKSTVKCKVSKRKDLELSCASAYLGYVHEKLIIQRAMAIFHSLSNKHI